MTIVAEELQTQLEQALAKAMMPITPAAQKYALDAIHTRPLGQTRVTAGMVITTIVTALQPALLDLQNQIDQLKTDIGNIQNAIP
jgi:hypothetical protein